jgi:CBS domain-containing protein
VKVREVMRRPVVTVGPKDAVWQALEVMISMRIGAVVVAEGERPVGILTESDVVRLLVDRGMGVAELLSVPVESVMSKPVITCNPDEDLVDALTRMLERRVRRLPVVENDRLVGILTERDLMGAMLSLLRSAKTGEARRDTRG